MRSSIGLILFPCSEVGNYDRVVIQEIIKEIAQTQQVDLSARHRFKGAVLSSTAQDSGYNFVIVVVINEADSLSRDAQAALRRTMEKYMSNLRIILCANSTSRLIAPIKSRCLLMRVAAPNRDEMLTVLNHVAKRAGAGSFPEDMADQIIADANGNMRKAILVFEAMKMQSYGRPINLSCTTAYKFRPDLSSSPPIAKPDWETYCYKVADMIIQEQTPQRVMEVRAKLYELLSHCIPATVVLKVRSLLDTCPLSYDSKRRLRNAWCKKSTKV